MTDPIACAMKAAPPPRRLIAVGTIRRIGGRTTQLIATPAGVTGRISPAVTR